MKGLRFAVFMSLRVRIAMKFPISISVRRMNFLILPSMSIIFKKIVKLIIINL